ncbi:Dynein axonemal light chain 1 (DNAL1) (Flagellar outer arm dynein light chain 1) (ODA-LC protein LC1) [Durusdinium trenchii]|uniref:Dynein axonemal light chain 1 n=1 Tax=Durusdinium trenchii TaxID=1381693 RepID=A0ABP0Q0V0_9DINO
MISLPALKNIEVLSLGRNLIKKISGLEEIGSTLKELWISYNQISTLDGLAPCVKLTTLFISNNKIKDWPELDKLQANQDLVNVLFYGNPIYEGLSKKQARPKAWDGTDLIRVKDKGNHVLEHLPKIATLDGELLTGDDDDGAGAPPRDRTGEKRRRSS